MTLYEFNALTDDEKISAVWSMGEFVADTINGSEKHLLYQFNEFYVELLYNGTDNRIKQIRSFKHGLRLEPYLKQIDISGLL